ncbi:hypothetical protein [Eubacterium aggregans]|uniref:hypothetical protein n=1 Tax=Eubacterium aggregans TaxID=81409 RepID=UPI003F3DCB16
MVAFDGAYEMDDIVLVRGEGEHSTYTYMTIRWWDEAGLAHTLKAHEDFTISSKKNH